MPWSKGVVAQWLLLLPPEKKNVGSKIRCPGVEIYETLMPFL
jgi:hypothetical protein